MDALPSQTARRRRLQDTGGLTHFTSDEAFDRAVLAAIAGKRRRRDARLPRGIFRREYERDQELVRALPRDVERTTTG